ncbi:MAG: hypothetical protein CMC55_04905 [Flavobacteriaceae bacterium]|uniref:hypothetical protein n=1 Tax=Bizionia echini TaxID=649333 RepID=UPI000C8A4D40|nr:hypothetical protein [Flavobacteriaceae bacterium]|tara:strand:- start:1209 stop:1892 length:684 start_codon:yes stop_codon:yes gene_type:complete
MALTDSHIENLYAFTRQHYVEYYDLQTELVDHMANDIEAIWEVNPTLSFEVARDKSFKKFGIFGFMDVVEQRQKAMSKIYMKLLWNYAKDWFRLPQIILTITIFTTLYTVFSTEIGSYIFIASYIILCMFLFVKTIRINRDIKRKREAKEKLWLLEDMIFRNAGLGTLVLGPQVFQLVNLTDNFCGLIPIICASVFTVIIIYTYISAIILPKNATFHLQETYPEYYM